MRGDATVLGYGRAPPTRWRRLIRWTIVALLLVALALAGLFAVRMLTVWLARREGYASHRAVSGEVFARPRNERVSGRAAVGLVAGASTITTRSR